MQKTRTTREAETRANNMQIQYNMEYVSPIEIPPGVKKEGYSYQWVNREIRGMPSDRVEREAARGWTLVPSDRAPQFAIDPLKRNPISTQYICYRDVILMERPSIYSEKDKETFNNKNANIMRSLQGVENDLSGFANQTRTINSF